MPELRLIAYWTVRAPTRWTSGQVVGMTGNKRKYWLQERLLIMATRKEMITGRELNPLPIA